MPETSCLSDEILRRIIAGNATTIDEQAHLDGCPGCRDRTVQLSTVSIQADIADTQGATVEAKPSMIGKYLIVGRLGDGGQGIVYRAIHRDLRRDAVIKLAHKRMGSGGIDRSRLLAEGRMLAELRQGNLVQVFDVDIHEGHPWLAMELVRGCTLKQRCVERQYSPKEAAALAAAVAKAVAYLHARGIVHQDIKPENIMIDEEGQPRLIDFGIARLRDIWSDAEAFPLGGTPGYMSPEQQSLDMDRIGPAADVYGLGGILFFLLAGQPPNRRADRPRGRSRTPQTSDDRPGLVAPGISKNLRRIVEKALANDPADRPSAKELAEQLDHCTAGVSRRKALIASLCLCFSLIGSGVWWWSRRPVEWIGTAAPNPLPANSTWAGTFNWTTDASEAKHVVRLKVTDQQGDRFKGVYETDDETGKYAFQVEGSALEGAVQWHFIEQLKGVPQGSVIKEARVEGTIKANNVMVVSYREGADHAVMTLFRTDLRAKASANAAK